MSKLTSLKTKLLVTAIASIAAVGHANAGIVFAEANFGGGNNVLFNTCSSSVVGGPAALVSGCLQNSNSTVINFSGAGENLTISGGQATLDAQDDFFTKGTIALADPTQAISAIGFSVNSREVNDNNGKMTFTADLLDPVTLLITTVTSSQYNLNNNGLNQFSITTTNGSLITSLRFVDNASNGIEDIRQVRFEAANRPTGQVPLPGSAALLALGGLAVGFARRKAK